MSDLHDLNIREIGNRTYKVDATRAGEVPEYYSNHVAVSITSDEVSLTFCIKGDAFGIDQDPSIAYPKVCIFVSPDHAERLAGVLAEGVRKIREASSPKSTTPKSAK